VSNLSSGKYAKFISDRSGLEFPYSEMVIEWNGARVHISEYEKKHPQLEPRPIVADPQGLRNARPARTEPKVAALLTSNPFSFESGSTTMTVSMAINSPRAVDDVVVFRNVSPISGVSSFNNLSFVVTSATTTNLTVNLSSAATETTRGGGAIASIGPVTLTP